MQICIMKPIGINNSCTWLYTGILAIILLAVSCVPARKIDRQGYLLNKNTVKIDIKTLPSDEIAGFIQQKPNKKFLGLVRLNTYIYERSKWNYLKQKLGVPPVILDTSLANTTVRHLKTYMASKGYFHASVQKEIIYKNKKANVIYHIKAGKPYTIRFVDYATDDDELKRFVFEDTASSWLKPGKIYDAYALDDERSRITNHLRNRGYYFFTRENIFYQADSNLNSHQMDITIEFKKQRIKNEALGGYEEKNHQRFRINHINFHTDLGSASDESGTPLVLELPQYPGNPTSPYLYRYYYYGNLRLKPQLLNRQIFTRGGQFYHAKHFSLTHQRLSSLPITKFVNIGFEPLPDPGTDGYGLLDCNIQIARSNTQVFSIEAEATNTGGFLGTGANFVYSNRNLFRGGEILTLKLKGAIEVQRALNEQGSFFLGFNTVETGIEARLEIPKLLIPNAWAKFSKHANPKTSLLSGLYYQRRPDYVRYISNLSYGFEYNETISKYHLLVPIELNSVRIYRSPEFTEWLKSLNDKRLINQYTDHLVPLFRYVYIYNNQVLRKNQNFRFFRGSIESSGSLIHSLQQLSKISPTTEGYYTLFGIQYAQFLRLDADYRYYIVLKPRNIIVIRTAAGIGKPFGNSDVLPVEKGFYSGGANGMRGWEIRSLGPGSFSDPANTYDRMGELWLEMNAEYRFPIYNWLHGAIFMDAGNIWMLTERIDFPGGEFKLNTFPEEIAFDGGLGLRFDLGFFIFRLDGAMKLKDPARPAGERWLPRSHIGIRDVIWNFGIGYPF